MPAWLVMQALGVYLQHKAFGVLHILILLLYMFGGYAAAQSLIQLRRSRLSKRGMADCVRTGAGTGLLLSLLGWISWGLFWSAFGTWLPSGLWQESVSLFLCGPVDVLVALVLGALGGRWLAQVWR